MENIVEVRHYVTPSGKDVFDIWLTRLADSRTQAKIATRIDRLAASNFGDCKPLREGVYELRIDWGPGHRVYYALIGRACVLLYAVATNGSSLQTLSGRSDISGTTRKGS